MSDRALSVFRVLGFVDFLHVFTDLPEALASFETGIPELWIDMFRDGYGGRREEGEYHLHSCKTLYDVPFAERVDFSTEDEARLAGRVGCEVCLG